MYDNPLSGRIANSIVQLMVISGNYRWLLGLRPRPHQRGCSSPRDPRLLPGSMLRIDMAWPPGKYRFQRPLLKSSSGSKGCCGTGFRTLSVKRYQLERDILASPHYPRLPFALSNCLPLLCGQPERKAKRFAGVAFCSTRCNSEPVG